MLCFICYVECLYDSNLINQKCSYRAVETRVNNVLKAVVNLGKLTEDLKNAIQASQTLTEVEHLVTVKSGFIKVQLHYSYFLKFLKVNTVLIFQYAPYKPGNKRSLAERAKELGLEEWADKVLEKPWWVDLNLAVKPGHKGNQIKLGQR